MYYFTSGIGISYKDMHDDDDDVYETTTPILVLERKDHWEVGMPLVLSHRSNDSASIPGSLVVKK